MIGGIASPIDRDLHGHPPIGAATTIALTVTGQQLISAAIDHRGWFRLPAKPVTTSRLAGLAALIAGCALVQLA